MGQADLLKFRGQLKIVDFLNQEQSRQIQDLFSGLAAGVGAAILTEILAETIGDDWADIIGGVVSGCLG